MKISLITVSYNSEETIGDTFDSVERQIIDGFDLEYIHIDGLSRDKTIEISNNYRNIISKSISENDSGIYNAMNKGISIATGEVIGFLNSDDAYCSNDILASVANVFKDKKVKASYGDLNYVRRHNVSKITRKWSSGRLRNHSFNFGWMPAHPTFFLRAECYKSFGSFKEEINSSADYELMLRMLHVNKLPAKYIKKTMVSMRDGGNSGQSVAHRLKVFKEDMSAWNKNGLGLGLFPVCLKVIRKIPQFLRAI